MLLESRWTCWSLRKVCFSRQSLARDQDLFVLVTLVNISALGRNMDVCGFAAPDEAQQPWDPFFEAKELHVSSVFWYVRGMMEVMLQECSCSL